MDWKIIEFAGTTRTIYSNSLVKKSEEGGGRGKGEEGGGKGKQNYEENVI